MKIKNYYRLVVFLILLTNLTTKLFAQVEQLRDTIVQIDSIRTHSLDEVVISVSKRDESILKSPLSIENVNNQFLKQSAGTTFFDALENVKGVQMITASLGFKIINTRGFTNTTNVRFTQLVDGIDNQAPHLGTPIGNAMGPSDLDIDRVEIMPGTASALYGLNAVNGLANFITKNPFNSIGLTFQQKIGVNHIGSDSSSPKIFSESSFRIAEKLSKKIAFKINGTFTKADDWIANDRTDLNSNANSGVGITGGINNPGYDPVNGYGNESSNRRILTLHGKRYVVARTGYMEQDVTDYDVQNVKTDLGLHYQLTPRAIISYTYRYAEIDNVYQRANRFALKDYILQQHSIDFKNNIFQFKAFITSENTGESYNLRSAAENLDRRFKSDNNWYSDFATAFNNAMATPGTEPIQALSQARLVADQGRLQPDTEEFNRALKELSAINNWDFGAALRVKDKLIHGEAQADLIKILGDWIEKKNGLDILMGVDYQSYIINPDGNYFINPTENDIFETFTYGKSGGFVQTSKSLLKGKIKLSATLRVDKNDYFKTKFNPRISGVITPWNNQSIRMSFQSGSRFPSIFEGFSNVNSGGVRRVGGLKVMSNGVFENAYLRSSIDKFQTAVTSDFNNGMTLDDAIEQEKGLLIKNYYTYLKPEHITSFEIGYKALFFKRRLKTDLDFYFNKYNNFIAQVEMNVPNTTMTDSIPYYLNDRTKQTRYRIYTNSQSIVYNFGASFGLSYLLGEYYNISANISYSELNRTDKSDGFEDGFNTPKWITNISFGGERIFKKIDFIITYKYQSSFYWRSFLVNGEVKAYGTIDAQASYDFMKSKFNVKLGATNVLNSYYNSFLGGPSIGGLYYTTVSYRLW